MDKKETDTLEESVHGFREKINVDKYLKNFSFIVFGLTLFFAGFTRLIKDLKESRGGEYEGESIPEDVPQEETERQTNYTEPEPTTIKGF